MPPRVVIITRKPRKRRQVTCAAAVAACELSAESGNSSRSFKHGHAAKG